MQNSAYVQINLLCMTILLIMAYKLRRADKSQEQFYLVTLMVGQSIMFLFDTAWEVIDSNPVYPPLINYLVNIIYFTVVAICPYLALRYFRLSLTGRVFSKPVRLLLLLPALLTFILCTVSLKTGWIFSVSQLNVYRRGRFYPVVYLLPLIYMICNSFAALRFGYIAKNRETMRRAKVLAVMFLLPVTGSAIQTLFSASALVCCFITATMVIVVIDYLQSLMTKDTLTQLSNRLDLMMVLEDRLEDYDPVNKGGMPLYLLFCDIDYFKSINDTFGHLEGDKALCTVANALRSACRESGAYPARIGGDEFVVLFSARDDDAAEIFRRDLKDIVLHASEGMQYALRLSAGLTRCTSEDKRDIKALLDRADDMLYEEKKSRASGLEVRA